MYTNTSITLFLYKNGAYTKYDIDKAFWDERKASNVVKSGLVNADSVKIFIPYTKDELEFAPSRDIVIRGKIQEGIDTTSEKTVAESKKKLQEKYGFVTVASCDKKLYGSKEMWHYELSCK